MREIVSVDLVLLPLEADQLRAHWVEVAEQQQAARLEERRDEVEEGPQVDKVVLREGEEETGGWEREERRRREGGRERRGGDGRVGARGEEKRRGQERSGEGRRE